MQMVRKNSILGFRACMTLGLAFSLLGIIVEAQYVDDYSFLLNDISVENILSNVEALSNFGTRYVLSERCNKSANFIYTYFSAIGGYKASFHPFQLPNRPGYWSLNVIAEKEGSNLKNETVIVFAHYDSTSTAPHTSAPGANDNAAGVAVLMEVARVLSTYELNRTLLFIAFSAEELGLMGSAAWVSENRELLSSAVGAICLDGVGRGGTVGVFYSGGKSGVLAGYMVRVALRLNFSRFYVGHSTPVLLGSDSGPFDEADIRVTRVWDFDTEYIHTPQDTPDTLDADCIGDVAALTTVVSYELSTKPLQELFLPEEETHHDNYSSILYVLAVAVCLFVGFILLLRPIIRNSVR